MRFHKFSEGQRVEITSIESDHKGRVGNVRLFSKADGFPYNWKQVCVELNDEHCGYGYDQFKRVFVSPNSVMSVEPTPVEKEDTEIESSSSSLSFSVKKSKKIDVTIEDPMLIDAIEEFASYLEVSPYSLSTVRKTMRFNEFIKELASSNSDITKFQ